MKFYYLTDGEINKLKIGLMSKKLIKIENINLIFHHKLNLIITAYLNHFLLFVSREKN